MLIEEEKKLLEKISDFFIFMLIIFFPIMIDSTGFKHILECKWLSYLTLSLLYIVSCVIVLIYYKVKKNIVCITKKDFNLIHYFALIFLLINVVSSIISPFFTSYNLFKGPGRGEGIIIILLYVITFIFVSIFCNFKKKYLLYFSISSIMLSTIAILQYFDLNIFNMYPNGLSIHNVSYISTIGNIDFMSSIYCIFLTISFLSFVFLEDKNKNKIIHFVSVFFGSFFIFYMNVSSGIVAFVLTFLLILPFIISNNKTMSKFLILLAFIIIAFAINEAISAEYRYYISSLNLFFVINLNTKVFLLLIISFILVYLSWIVKRIDYCFYNNKKLIKKIYFILFTLFFCFLIFVYLYNFKDGMLYEMHELLHGNFNDNFGTYRIFLWKRALNLFHEFPIIGSGSDTFVIRFMEKYANDIASIGQLSINDTAANIYLTMLINIGIVGLLSYLIFIFYQIKLGLKKKNDFSFVLLITIVCYLIQDFFNLWLVITTPLFWLLMAIHYSSIHYKKDKN